MLIAPEYPTWIVLDDDEYNMFSCLEETTLGDALILYNERFDKDSTSIRERLLEKIFNHNFIKTDIKIAKMKGQ